MNKYQFQDQPAKTFSTLPAGDHVLRVIGYETGISAGKMTNGSDHIQLKFAAEPNGEWVFETFIFHPECTWKLDNFLKASALVQKKGDEVDLSEEFLMGARAWATTKVEEYPLGSGKFKARVVAWITNKPKLEPIRPAPIPFSNPTPTSTPAPSDNGDDDLPF